MPTINGRVDRHTFRTITERVDNRLSGWKSKGLSPARRATLIQPTISSIPYYAMQTARLPQSLCDDIDRKSQRFLWGGNAKNRTIHNVAWEQLMKPKEAGGLGFQSMRQVNSAFLAKLGFRLVTKKEKLWSRILRAKYCQS